MPAFAIDPELYADLTKPTPAAPPPTREQQLEAALDALLMLRMEEVLDRNALDEFCANNRVAAERLLDLMIRDLTWRRERLQPRAPAQ